MSLCQWYLICVLEIDKGKMNSNLIIFINAAKIPPYIKIAKYANKCMKDSPMTSKCTFHTMKATLVARGNILYVRVPFTAFFAGVLFAGVLLAEILLAGVLLAGVLLAGVLLAGVLLAGVLLPDRVLRRDATKTTHFLY